MHALWWTVIVLLMLAGLAGAIFPLIPDTPLIVVAAVLHHLSSARAARAGPRCWCSPS